jgi:hypothetical protein
MTRTVFDNAMTAHVWANQSVPEGRSNNGNFYFYGRRLYSYGSHFIVGIILPGVGPVLNSDGYSISTAKHKGYAARATSYVAPSFPGLTGIADDLETLARAYSSTGETARRARADSAGARNRLAAYLEAHAAELGDKAGALTLRLMGSRADWAAFKARAIAKAARKAEAARKADRKADRERAAEYAGIPLPLFVQRATATLDRYSARRLDDMISETRAAHLAAGGPRIKAAVWARLKALRRLRKAWDSNKGNADRRAAIANLRRLRAGDYSSGGTPLAQFPTGRARAWRTLERETLVALNCHMPPATRAGLERVARVADAAARRIETREETRQRKAEARRRLLRTVQSLRDWRDKWESRETDRIAGADLRTHIAEGRPVSVLRTVQSVADLLADFTAAGRFPALAARLEALRAGPVAEALLDAEARVNDWNAAERAARAAWLAMSPDERREAWRAGETVESAHGLETAETGPLLRANAPEVSGCNVTGGELETSQGARVPLRHAFRVFQFVAACRRAGQPWRPVDSRQRGDGAYMPGPSAIRVGHFRVDSITAAGDFKAGCHAIRWAEVERLADRLGVAGCMADPETISGELESAS